MEGTASGTQSSAFIESDGVIAPPPLDIARFPFIAYGVFFPLFPRPYFAIPAPPLRHSCETVCVKTVSPLFFRHSGPFFFCHSGESRNPSFSCDLGIAKEREARASRSF